MFDFLKKNKKNMLSVTDVDYILRSVGEDKGCQHCGDCEEFISDFHYGVNMSDSVFEKLMNSCIGFQNDAIYFLTHEDLISLARTFNNICADMDHELHDLKEGV
jgi:hypothetical protein